MSQSFTYPSLMYPSVIIPTNSKTNVNTSSLDVAVLQDNEEDGYNNAGLEIYNEFVGVANRELINRELVNLENANVNIDNSSDVIIGPVTQFNVNGNVTIYQGKDGQPVGIDENTEIPNGSCEDQSSRPQKEEQDVTFWTKRKYTFKFYLGAILLLFLLTGITVILFFLLKKDTQQQVYESPKDTIDIGDHQLIPKEIWNGKIVSGMTPMNPPVDLVIVKHTAGGTCEDFESCAKKMRSLQSSDISINKLKDVYFNFAVGGDGNVYIGRDWNVQPASDFDCTYNGNDSNYVKLKILEFLTVLKKYSVSYISCLLVAVFFILTAVQYMNTQTKNCIYRDSKIDGITIPSNCQFFIFNREDWGGIRPSSILPRQNTIQFVIIKHTGKFFCETEAKCKQLTKRIQREHISKNYSDIAYNFLIGGDGNIYIGRGFNVLGENVTKSLDIAIHGNFYFDQYYEHMIRATKVIVDYGLETNLISGNFSLLCHNQTLNGTDSPGRNVYKEVITWQNYNYDWQTYFNYNF